MTPSVSAVGYPAAQRLATRVTEMVMEAELDIELVIDAELIKALQSGVDSYSLTPAEAKERPKRDRETAVHLRGLYLGALTGLLVAISAQSSHMKGESEQADDDAEEAEEAEEADDAEE